MEQRFSFINNSIDIARGNSTGYLKHLGLKNWEFCFWYG